MNKIRKYKNKLNEFINQLPSFLEVFYYLKKDEKLLSKFKATNF